MKHQSQSGSAIFIILIAVALFAALSFAVGNMMRSGNAEKITEQKAEILAGEIIDYGRKIKQAVQSMRISNGCEDTDISFENNVVSGYTNGTNTACQVFHPSGGGMSYVVPSDGLLASVSPVPALYGEHYFTGGVPAENIGTGAYDLVYYLPYISRVVCIELNAQIGVDNPGGEPPVESSNGWPTSNIKFTGSYSSGGTQLQRDGTMSGCFEGNDASSTPPENTYHFYQILIPR